MNFKVDYVNNTGRNHFGDLTPDGNYTGALNALENEEVDLAANLRTIQTKKLVKAISLYPVHQKGFSILVPKRHYNLRVSYVEAIEYSCGVALIVFMILVFVMWIKLGDIYRKLKIHDEQPDSLRVALIILGILLITSQPAPKFRHEKCLMIAVIFSSMILSSTYQAKMVQHLNTSKKSSDIKNVRELLESNLKIAMPISLKNTLPLESLSSDRKLTKGKSVILTSNVTKVMDDVANRKDTAYLNAELFCELMQVQLYDKKGNRNTHVIRNVKTVPSSMMTLKRSPYRHRFNQILLALCETGMMNKVFFDFFNEIAILKLKKDISLKEDPNFYTMDQLGYIFISFWATLGACCLVFIGEILMSYYHKDCSTQILEHGYLK